MAVSGGTEPWRWALVAVLVPLLVVVLLTEFDGRRIFGMRKELVGAAIFGVASLTDWLDGYLARRRGQALELLVVEAEQAEVVVHLLQGRQLEREHLVIPLSDRIRRVIRQAIRPHLRLGQVRGDMDRHLGEPELLGRGAEAAGAEPATWVASPAPRPRLEVPNHQDSATFVKQRFRRA